MAVLQLYDAKRDGFERQLQDAGAGPAADACARLLSELRRGYADAEGDAHKRRLAAQLFSVAEAGVMAMVSVSQVDIRMKLVSGPASPAISGKRRRQVRTILQYLPGALCLLLAAWLYLDGKMPAAILALVCGGISYATLFGLKRPARALPDVAGETRVDPVALSRRMEKLVQAIDGALGTERQPDAEPLQLTQGLLESIQMLMEAKLTEDGGFALRALPGMMDQLARQGVTAQLYGEDLRQHFDLLPAPVGGDTIRPALLKDGRVLSRGQATTKEL